MRESLCRAATSHLALLSPEEERLWHGVSVNKRGLILPFPAVEEALPVLVLAAEAIADCLAFGNPLRRTRAAAMQEVFLQESLDESDEAAARCKAIREAFADEVHKAVLTTPSAVECTSGFKQPVRVEVRGTAGRAVTDRAFTVGARGECDVQVLGDPGVLPLQFLVVKLPFCSVIADFWSDCATRVTWRMSAKERSWKSAVTRRARQLLRDRQRRKSGPTYRCPQHSGTWAVCSPDPEREEDAARTFEEAFSSPDCVQVVAQKCRRRSSSASTSCGSLLDDSCEKPDSSDLQTANLPFGGKGFPKFFVCSEFRWLPAIIPSPPTAFGLCFLDFCQESVDEEQ
eukprot:s932_g7.t1